MKIMITGATGYIGHNLAMAAARRNHLVNVLVRDIQSLFLPVHANIRVIKGDILDKVSVLHAMEGCNQVYHTAAMVAVWAKNSSEYFEVNIEGTRNVLEAALQCGIEKLVVTSTCGVIGPSLHEPMCETDPRIAGFSVDYELSKKIGEDLAFQYARQGLNVVVVSPSKVFGPGNVSHSLTANAVIKRFLNNGFAIIPSPGTYKACFAYIDDVVNGHLLAMEKGRSGEKYILGGINISYRDFFDRIRSLSFCKGKIIQFSKAIVKVWAFLQQLRYRILGIPPQFPVKAVDILFSNYTFSSEKASRELGYKITPLDDALNKTINHFKKN